MDTTITANDIGKRELELMAEYTLKAMQRYFADPENMAKYEAWLEERNTNGR